MFRRHPLARLLREFVVQSRSAGRDRSMAGRARRAQGNVPPGRAREAHKLLYEHNGKGDADKAERVAWRENSGLGRRNTGTPF